MAIQPHEDRGGPLYERITTAALACRSDEERDSPLFLRHAVWERLIRPDLFLRFPVLWTDDSGSLRAARGYLAVYAPGGPCRSDVLLRDGLTEDALCARAFSLFMESRLCPPAGGAALAGADRDPSRLSAGESMRLCRSLREALGKYAPSLLRAAGPELPDRERGYLHLPEPGSFGPAEAAGRGLCFFVREALRRAGQGGLQGKTLALRGNGPAARCAAGCARRLGARIVASDDPAADLVFLFDTDTPLDEAGAETLISRRPEGVFEGAPLACAPEAAARLAEGGLLFAPAIAAGAGALALPPEDGSRSVWETERLLRAATAQVLQKVLAADPADLYRGAWAAALCSGAEALVRRGL